uniref:Uncharacterized protein n=1 Tax=viral metagenome TaxID=1070528 RepID=A0A6C0F652_9ZZZZ|tara:strand:- start:16581 stop:16889 length:309 start_codon:yes stop_codon:yes gene_type:complete
MLILNEMLIFWLFLFVGTYVDKLLALISNHETETIYMSFAMINIQIIALVLAAVYLSRKFAHFIKDEIPGAGLLLGYSFLATQKTFDKRVQKVSKEFPSLKS